MIRRYIFAMPVALALGFTAPATAQQAAESPDQVTIPTATLSAPASAPAGSKVKVTWTGPGNDPANASDFIAIALLNGKTRHRINVIYGSPHQFGLPDQAGEYELRYVRDWDHKPTEILARQRIEVTTAAATPDATTAGAISTTEVLADDLPEASLQAPASAVAGSAIKVAWTGPGDSQDSITIAAPDGKPIGLAKAGYGSPAKLTMPDEPGSYELRYYYFDGSHILARRSIEVTPVEATLGAPASAPAGSRIDITWTGPGEADDRISVNAVDTEGDPINFNHPESAEPGKPAEPVTLQVPMTPGTYELRYVLDSGVIAARETLEVTPMTEATLDLPSSAPAGSTIKIEWAGPQELPYKRVAYIVIVEPDTDGDDYFSQHLGYGHDPEFSATLPGEPGIYEVRYKLASLGEVKRPATIIARRSIKATPVEATLDLPDAAPAGSTIEVTWTGPEYEGDNIVVVQPRDSGLQWIDYYQTKGENPLKITLPDEPGSYEVRYMVNTGYPGQWTLARETIEVENQVDSPAPAESQAKPDASEPCAAGACSDDPQASAQTRAASSAAVTACDSRRCFADKFASCQPATYFATKAMGTAKYQILGATDDGCRVALTYLSNPNPAWVEKPLACTYDNSLAFKQAAMKALSSAFSGSGEADCEGMLLDVL